MAPSSARLRLTLFGHMRAETSDGRCALPTIRKTRAVLAILALAGARPVLRSQIGGLLWSRRGQVQARASLRQAVHELRRTLASAGRDIIQADRHQITLSGEGIWVDAVALTRGKLSQSDPLDLPSGTLLADLRGIDPEFDRFLATENRRLLQVARTLGESLLLACNEPDELLATAERLVKIDPLHEVAWRAVISARAARGERSAAIAAFECCRTALAASAQCVPAPETYALVEDIRCRSVQLPEPNRTAKPGSGSASAGKASGDKSDGPRLAILPLRQLGGYHDDGLASGLTAEIIAALARFRWMSARITSAALLLVPDSQPRCLDADFALDGTIQRDGNRIRVILTLCDLRSQGDVIWGHRFDREIRDIFAVQEGIAAETAAQIDLELLLWDAKRRQNQRAGASDAKDLVIRAIPAIYRLEPTEFRAAGEMLDDALAADPANAAAHAWSAYWHLLQVGQGWAQDTGAATSRAVELAQKAVILDPSDARALTLAGHIRGFLGKHPHDARALHERAIRMNPNLALAWCFSGLAHSYLGEEQQAIDRLRHAQQLSPKDPHSFFFDTALIMPFILRGDYESASDLGRRAVALNPGFSSAYKVYLAALGHLGRSCEAADIRARLLALEPGFCVAQAIARSPMARTEDVELYADGLRRAGLPE